MYALIDNIFTRYVTTSKHFVENIFEDDGHNAHAFIPVVNYLSH